MKLLTKTTGYYVAFSLLAFICGGVILYSLVKNILYHEIDENLITEQILIEEAVNHSDSIPDYHSVFGHTLELVPGIRSSKHVLNIHDTLVYIPEIRQAVQCRHLQYIMLTPDKRGLTIHIFKPLTETKRIIAEILFAVVILFISLMIILITVNYFVSRRVWIPFNRTLALLSDYELTQEESLDLPNTTIREFRMLNRALLTMSKKIREDYLSLKEFNENAAHELQTPLAVIKSKIDLMVQDENLTEDQMKRIGSIYDSLRRMSKMNQGLLLISKIENNQFRDTEEVDVSEVLARTLDHFSEIREGKKIGLETRIQPGVLLSMNRTLAEILVTNLVSNAILHNIPGGGVSATLTRTGMTISNTGNPVAIEPERLFERFRKSERTGGSVGLGLAIVRKIVLLYGMNIDYACSGSIHILKISF